jgi:hypothetical protein
MFKPLASASKAFEAARSAHIAAVQAGDADAAHEALAEAVSAADAVLVFLGYVEPYACGECDACKANAADDEEERIFRTLLASLDFAGDDEVGK